MAEFVLVHGSGQNASCWSRVASELSSCGHTVATPDLPKRAPDWGLADFAARIAESITGSDTVVVAHSLSGAFLPLVPALRPCARIVFLAAVIPEPGKCVREQFTEDPAMFSPQWIRSGERWFDPAERESLAREFLFHDCDEATLAWALGTVDLLQVRHVVTQPSPLATWPDVPVASIVATGDRTLSADWGRRTTRRVLGCDAIEIDAGHCPHVSRPRATAELLARLARGSFDRPSGEDARV